MPVRTGHVAAGAADAHVLRVEPVDGVRDLGEARHLPGHLVDGDIGRDVAAAAGGVVDGAVAQDHRMVVGAVAQEIHVGVARASSARRASDGARRCRADRRCESRAGPRSRNREARRGIGHVQAEMAQPADLERLRSSTPPTSNLRFTLASMDVLRANLVLVIRKQLLGERHARHPVAALVIVLADAAEFLRALLAHLGRPASRARCRRRARRPARGTRARRSGDRCRLPASEVPHTSAPWFSRIIVHLSPSACAPCGAVPSGVVSSTSFG